MVKLTHKRLQRKQRYALGDVEDAGGQEREDVAEQGPPIWNRTYRARLSYSPPAHFDGLDDGG